MKLGFFDFYQKIQEKKLLEQDGFEPVQGAGMASMNGQSNVGNAPVNPQFNSFEAPENSTADPNNQYNGMGDENGMDGSEMPEDENQDNLSEPEGGLDFNQIFSHLSELGKFTNELQGLEEDKGAEFEQILNQLEQLILSFPGADAAQQMGQEGEEDQEGQEGQNQRQGMPDNQNMPAPESGPESEGGPGEAGPGGAGGFGGPGGGGGAQMAGQSQNFQGGSYPVAGGVPAGPGGIY